MAFFWKCIKLGKATKSLWLHVVHPLHPVQGIEDAFVWRCGLVIQRTHWNDHSWLSWERAHQVPGVCEFQDEIERLPAFLNLADAAARPICAPPNASPCKRISWISHPSCGWKTVDLHAGHFLCPFRLCGKLSSSKPAWIDKLKVQAPKRFSISQHIRLCLVWTWPEKL